MQILEAPLNIPTTSVAIEESDLIQRHENLVLVVEDDLAQRPLWEKAFKSVDREIRVDWATSMEEAERLIRFRYQKGAPYKMVVADIFLEGTGSGIDLWNRYGEETLNFVFVSALPLSKFELLMSLNFGCPLYLKKPLNWKKCREVAEMVLSPGG